MGRVVALDVHGRLVYDGLLSSQEKATIDQILNALKNEIPQIESDLETVYGKSVLYKYNLGLFLGELLNKYEISIAERRKFWDEIKTTGLNKSLRKLGKMIGANLKKHFIYISKVKILLYFLMMNYLIYITPFT